MTLTDAELADMRDDMEALLPVTGSILTLTRASDGQGGWTETWGTATASVACRLDYVQGRSIYTGGAIQPYTGWMVTLPYDAVVTANNRIKIGTHTYSVTGLDDGKSWQLCIRAKVEQVS